jgi:hypothetical protein
MLKKTSSFVLVARRPATYRQEYVSVAPLLWPRWTAFLSILNIFVRRSDGAFSGILARCVVGLSGAY